MSRYLRPAARAASASLVVLATGCGHGAGMGPPPPEPGALTLTTVATIPAPPGTAHTPTFAIAPPGDLARLMVLDKAGLIYVVRHDTLLARPFLDLQALVTAGVGNEQGLLGMAFSPHYATDHSVYVCYNALDWSVTVARYHVSADPDRADSTSAQILLSQPHSTYSNHNGGMIAFGPDGYLYVGLGDGGSAGDPFQTGQNPDDWLASILRLDVSGGGAGYATPPDNPFPDAGHPGGKPEVWCYGLRNPWRFCFDRATGDLYIADVGQDAYEEVDVASAVSGRGRGVDYGWSVMEGDSCFNPASGCDTTGKQRPVIAYAHDATQDCVIGGYVYRGAVMPGLAGTYFYSDNYGRWLRSFRYLNGVATSQKDWGLELAPSGDAVNSFGEDARGELYVCCYRGAIKRIGP